MSVEAGVVMPDPLSLIRCACVRAQVCLFLAASIVWLSACLCTCVSRRVFVCVHGVMEAEGLWQVENGPGLFI